MTFRLPSSPWVAFAITALFVLMFAMMIDPAFAQATSGAASFRCSGGHAVGTLYDSSMNCPTTLKTTNVFSFLVCNMEHLASNLMGEMYCGILQDLIPAVTAMLTLAVLFFGTGFTIGVIPATARDFQLFLLKVTCIFVFATQADYLIGTGYNILVSGLREGTAIGISAMFTDTASASADVTGADIYGYLDRFFSQSLHYATDYVGAKWDGSDNPCKNAIFAVMAVMAVAFPPIFYICVIIILRISITFLRAVFGYLYSLIGIVFLLTLAPIFLSFYLFQKTTNFFNKWLGYLVSFTLQMVILFAFLGFIFSIKVDHVASSLVGIVIPVKQNLESSTLRAPWKYCTLCDFDVVDESGKPIENYGSGELIKTGKLVCKKGADGKPVAITPFNATAPQEKADADKTKSIQNALIKFAATGLLSLLILAYLIEYLLNYVPALSAFLASGLGGSAPQLGGGTPIGQRIALDAPGGGLYNAFEGGFTAGYIKNVRDSGIAANSVGAATQGFLEASKRLITGGGTPEDPGLVQSFTNFILNPNRDTYKY